MNKRLHYLLILFFVAGCCSNNSPCECKKFGETIMFNNFTDKELSEFYVLKLDSSTGIRLDSSAVTFIIRYPNSSQWAYNEEGTKYTWVFINRKLRIMTTYSHFKSERVQDIKVCYDCAPKTHYKTCQNFKLIYFEKNGIAVSTTNPSAISNPYSTHSQIP